MTKEAAQTRIDLLWGEIEANEDENRWMEREIEDLVKQYFPEDKA